MSTSGQTVLTLSGDDIINAAYRKLMVIGEGVLASATQLVNGRQALNTVVAEFRTLGMSLWARKALQCVLVPGQKDYIYGMSQSGVYAIPYPLKVYTANLLMAPVFSTKQIINPLSFTDMALLPQGVTGTPVNFSYQPGNDIGTFRLWPVPDTSVTAGTYIEFLYQTPFQYFIASTDTPDFPEEWNNALIYQTAVLLSDEVGTSSTKQQSLMMSAQTHLATALSAGTEEASFYIQRDWTGYGNYGGTY